MNLADDIALNRETVDAQLEIMPRAPLRMLACGHERRTHRTDVARCDQCRGERHAVLTEEQCRTRVAEALRAARDFENHALIARQRAAAYQQHAGPKGDTGR